MSVGGHPGDALGRTSPATTVAPNAIVAMIAALAAGVEALDVRGGVALGVAQPLRLGERVAVAPALLGHLGEDVVGGAVDDAHAPG